MKKVILLMLFFGVSGISNYTYSGESTSEIIGNTVITEKRTRPAVDVARCLETIKFTSKTEYKSAYFTCLMEYPNEKKSEYEFSYLDLTGPRNGLKDIEQNFKISVYLSNISYQGVNFQVTDTGGSREAFERNEAINILAKLSSELEPFVYVVQYPVKVEK